MVIHKLRADLTVGVYLFRQIRYVICWVALHG